MEIIITDQTGGIPPYPYRKVVMVADRAEVAEVPCQADGSENIVFHADLLALLKDRDPTIADDVAFTPGWLTEAEGEATLHVAASTGISSEDGERIGRAMSDWCERNGVTKLTITDTTRKSGAETTTTDDWDIFSTLTKEDGQ